MFHALKSLLTCNSVHFKAGAVALVASGCLAGAVDAQTLNYWSWEGEDGQPNSSGTWWEDKAGNNAMRATDGTLTRLELPAEGPGAAFPNPIPNPDGNFNDSEVNQWGINASAGRIRTFSSGTAFSRDSFTIETFFNANDVEGAHHLLASRWHGDQFRAGVRDGALTMSLYHPETGDFVSDHTINNSSLQVSADVDYYVAFAVSTGENEEDRFIDFYLQDLTNGGPLQHERVSIWEGFESLFPGDPNLAMYVGWDYSFPAIGDVRYSDGVLDQSQLLIPEPGSSALLLGGLALMLGRRRA
ncbi:PEP-CTERM sorting domain-containing protein [Phycisphaerales bacterium AB-hyl4]|uniref:PEP-CTERM sorting domain-containing protein n=1 Tax=Natronomicrosphaera hydrolytica TaxID=3242702 RepID=A0ABV4U741_9BACT